MVDGPTVLVVLSADLVVAGWKRVLCEGMVDELTLLVVAVVLSADLVEVAGWK